MSVASKKIAESVFEAFTEDDTILWQEWSDAAINKENWANPKNGPDGLFLDTQLVQLPPSLEPYEWIRAKDLENLNEPLKVFVVDAEEPDLIINNKHLLHSQFVRWFISAIVNLQYCGQDGLQISGENGNFIWNGRYQCWRGWLNVYSMNKAGKGTQHRPVVNPNGKYVVRLYFLGAWRRIVVDDMIPVNTEKLPLLPRTINNSELWPMLLAKALLKLCSLSWTENREIVDFHPVTCLTGWVCLQLDIGYLSPQDKWDFLRKYADHFEWVAEAVDQESQEEASRSKKSKDERRSKETVPSKKSKDTGRSKASKTTDDTKRSKTTDKSKKAKGNVQKLKALVKPQPVTLFLGLDDMKEVSSEIVPELAPCLSHFIYVTQSRDIPLDPRDVKPPLARWKLFRWLKWAIAEGIIDPIEYFVPIRSLKVISPLKKCEESIINQYTSTNMQQNDQNIQDSANDKREGVKDTERSSVTRKEQQKRSKDLQTQTSKRSLSLRDASFWADFNKIEPFVKDVHFFYKLDYFQYTAKLSDRFAAKQLIDQRSETKKGSKKDSRRSSPTRASLKDPDFIDAYCWPQKMSKTRNEPLYIFTDSLEEKFFLIDFSTFQPSVISIEDSPEESNENDKEATNLNFRPTIKLKGNEDCLTIEKHNWFRRPEKASWLISVVTSGTKSTVLELNRGRHLLKMYCHSEEGCFVTISSDTIFHVGDRRKMYQLMSTESETVDQIAKHISNSISSAYQAFGSEKYSEALTIYYNSYLPSFEEYKEGDKLFYNQIHDYFIDEQVQLIKKILPENEIPGVLRALRIFFLNHTIGLECFNAISVLLKNLRVAKNAANETEEDMVEESTEGIFDKNNAAAVIQSFFKMITVRKYRKIHDPTHKEHEAVSKNLLKIAELFNYNKRESIANQVLRNTLKHHDKLYNISHCSKDFEYTLQVQELKGTLTNIKPDRWIPIIRLVVNPQVAEIAVACIDLQVSLSKYSVRVFNNKTGGEILRVVNNVVPTRYHHSELGYTIFCYGWREEQTLKELPWSLSIIAMKGQPALHFVDNEELVNLARVTAPPVLVIEELSNYYIPNSKNFIAKWMIKTIKPSVVSFRLNVSYGKARIHFKVIDDQGEVLSQIKGTAVITLPMVYLGLERKSDPIIISEKDNSINNKIDDSNIEEHFEEEKANGDVSRMESKEYVTPHRIYYVEASVLDNTWPLTKTEWSVVSEFRVKPTGSLVRTKISSSLSIGRQSKVESVKSKRGSKQSVESTFNLKSPYWTLQVITDFESGLEICQDRTKEKEIARMKEAWAIENPDSLERGKELREAFIRRHEIKPKISTGSIERKASSHSEKSSTKSIVDSQETLLDTTETSMPHLEERTLKPPPSLRRLPRLDLTIYEVKEDEEDKAWVKTESDEEVLRNMRTMNVIYAQEDYTHFLDELENLFKKQKNQNEVLYGRYRDSFWDRRSVLEGALEIRQSYISSMKPVAPPSTKSKSTKTKTSNKSTKSKKT